MGYGGGTGDSAYGAIRHCGTGFGGDGTRYPFDRQETDLRLLRVGDDTAAGCGSAGVCLFRAGTPKQLLLSLPQLAEEITPFSKLTHLSWQVREVLARVKSFFLVEFNVKPTYLGEPIPITGDGRASWD